MPPILYIKVCLQEPWGVQLYMCKRLFKLGSRESCTESDKLPQEMSFKAATVVFEDYKFENEKYLVLVRKK